MNGRLKRVKERGISSSKVGRTRDSPFSAQRGEVAQLRKLEVCPQLFATWAREFILPVFCFFFFLSPAPKIYYSSSASLSLLSICFTSTRPEKTERDRRAENAKLQKTTRKKSVPKNGYFAHLSRLSIRGESTLHQASDTVHRLQTLALIAVK